MTYDEIVGMTEEIGLPVAYDHFAEGKSPNPPFLIFLFPSSTIFPADGRVYAKIHALHFELYTDKKQPDIEAKVEAVLDRYGIFYDKSEVWIAEDRLYAVIYTMEVLSNEQ